ncbi:hypothetical protein [Pseudoalteromonas sp. SR41-6]|uniref:hypothetical protein n=1 Tax=Pseudoalteromonas sp. SR41-6 TaxID=2760948 RepID=UPI0015FFA6F2|nr:hypothetical protein [Pseudoalteromonas sp. SR41-6]MBB1333929.1 hypothetical protein [Pseudoalteromonas sp. SR41-6]
MINRKKQGRPKKKVDEKLIPRFTLTLTNNDWNELKSNTEHLLSFTRQAIKEKIERDKIDNPALSNKSQV